MVLLISDAVQLLRHAASDMLGHGAEQEKISALLSGLPPLVREYAAGNFCAGRWSARGPVSSGAVPGLRVRHF
jgi:hypothetical protein